MLTQKTTNIYNINTAISVIRDGMFNVEYKKSFKKSILIIEKKELAEMYKIILNKKHISVSTVYDSNQAINLAYEKNFDLIVLDLLSSKTKIKKFLKRIKSNTKTKNIPILGLGNIDKFETKHLKDLGVSSFLPKLNTTPKKLIKKIKEILK